MDEQAQELVMMNLALDEVLTLDSWVTSDQHWGELQTERPKDFGRVMWRRWRRRVQPGEVVLNLGDLGGEGGWLHGLPGRKLILLGNLDRRDADYYAAFSFEVLGRGDRPFYWRMPTGDERRYELVAFSHEPLNRKGEDQFPFDVNVHGHIHAGPLWEDQYAPGRRVNVSVDVTDFAPIRLREALERES